MYTLYIKNNLLSLSYNPANYNKKFKRAKTNLTAAKNGLLKNKLNTIFAFLPFVK